MKKYKIGKYIIKAKSVEDSVKIYKKIKDSDRLKQLAYKFAETGSYFDRANMAQSRELLSKNDESKLFEYYKLALEVKKQLEKEIPMMKNQEDLYIWDNDILKLLKAGISKFYWVMTKYSDSRIGRQGQLLYKELNKLLDEYSESKKYKKDSIKDTINDIDIDQLSEEEREAIDDYKAAIAGTNDPKLLQLFAHILKEETEHLEELQNEEIEDSIKDGGRWGPYLEIGDIVTSDRLYNGKYKYKVVGFERARDGFKEYAIVENIEKDHSEYGRRRLIRLDAGTQQV